MNDELALIDTNILIYAYDESEPEKKAKCKEIVERILTGKARAAVSNQVLAELYNGLTGKIEFPLKKEDAFIIVESFLKSGNMIKINYDSQTVAKAIAASIKYKMHFWDALIAATMLENQLFKIFTENEKDFGKIEHIKAINPL